MRYQRLFVGDVCVAEGLVADATAIRWAFWCPTCGNRWGRVEGPNAVFDWGLVRHYCLLHPERYVAYLAHGHSELRVPGSLIHTPVNFLNLLPLLLTNPLFARHEFFVHNQLEAYLP